MGKKKSRKKYTSSGILSSVSSERLLKPSERDNADRELNKLNALQNGKSVWITISNPDKENTKERFIRQKVSWLKSGKNEYMVMK